MTSYIDSEGVERFLGNNPAPLRYTWPVYGDTDRAPMVPRAEWGAYCLPEYELFPYLPPVHDQDGIGMCNASATVACMEACRAVEGLTYVKLSGGDLYGRINGGSDRGSLLEDGLQESMNGVASVETCPYLDWRKRSQEQTAERKKYVVLEAFICPSFDHCMSAVICGFGMVSGIMWGSNFEPDQDGWLPNTARGGGGHAVYGYAPAMRNNKYGIWHQNSWSPSWGRNGRCVFPEPVYSGQVGGWWAVRVVTADDGDTPTPVRES